jgi:hypothetical protein
VVIAVIAAAAVSLVLTSAGARLAGRDTEQQFNAETVAHDRKDFSGFLDLKRVSRGHAKVARHPRALAFSATTYRHWSSGSLKRCRAFIEFRFPRLNELVVVSYKGRLRATVVRERRPMHRVPSLRLNRRNVVVELPKRFHRGGRRSEWDAVAGSPTLADCGKSAPARIDLAPNRGYLH